MKKVLPALMLLFASLPLFAQGPSSYWYFGQGAGLRFTNYTAVPDTLGKLFTAEGSAVISDQSGNLLFYTHGTTIWNKNHQVMPNGSGLYGGAGTTTQSSIIINVPLDNDRYYVFTVEAQAGFHGGYGGISYSEVDMSLDNGNGDVINKNTPLLTPTAEKLNAVHHYNGRDVWVVCQEYGSNKKYAWLITPTGLNTTPVVSSTGVVHTGGDVNSCAQGHMKFSSDGTKLAEIYGYSSGFKDSIELFDFDNLTGVISNPVKIGAAFGTGFYGLEFSPDGSKIYGTSWSSIMYQWDLSAGSSTAINNSRTTIVAVPFSPTMHKTGGIQLGIDGKIYVSMGASSDSLGVIHNPNQAGTNCNFVENGLYLHGKRCDMGLPNFNQSYFNSTASSSGKSAYAGKAALITAYPNPFTSRISVLNEMENAPEMTLTVTDIMGRTVFTANSAEAGGNYHPAIDLEFLENGTYFLIVNIKNERLVKKIVKM
jgi:hypothetical protein